MVYEETRGFINPLLEKPKALFDPLRTAEYLVEVSKIKGEFKYSEGAKKVYSSWYYDLRSKDTADKTGTVQRVHNHVEKTAMCLALARDLTMEIQPQDIDKAIEVCTTLLTHVDKVMQGSGGKSEIAQEQAMVLQLLIKAPPEYELTRQKVLQKLFGDVDSFVLNRVIETLTEAKAVTATTRGGHIYYKLTPGYLKQLEEWKRIKKNG